MVVVPDNVWCPWCPVNHQPDNISRPGQLKQHLIASHDIHAFASPPDTDFWKSDNPTLGRRKYVPTFLRHSKCGKVYVAGGPLVRHEQACLCCANHIRQLHADCNCGTCEALRANNDLEFRCCDSHCSNNPLDEHTQNFLKATAFLSSFDESQLFNNVGKIYRWGDVICKRFSICKVLILKKLFFCMNSNHPDIALNRDIFVGNCVKLFKLFPMMCARHLGKKESRLTLTEKFMNLEFEFLFNDSKDNWTRKEPVPLTAKATLDKQKKKAVDQNNRGQSAKALKTVMGEKVKTLNQENIDVLKTKFPTRDENDEEVHPEPGHQMPADWQDFTELDVKRACRKVDLNTGSGPSGAPAFLYLFPFRKSNMHLTPEEREYRKLLTKLCNLICKGNRLLCKWFINVRLLGLFKPGAPDDARPIQILDFIVRLCLKLLMIRCKPKFKRHFGNVQFALNESAIETVNHFFHDFIQKHPLGGILKIDLKNAFNSLKRSKIMRILLRLFPELCAVYDALNNTNFRAFISGISWLWVCEGVRQGDPLAMAIYCLTIQSVLTDLRQRLGEANIGINKSYADDLFIGIYSMTNETMNTFQPIFDQLVNDFKDLGQEIRFDKCHVWSWNPNVSGEICPNPEMAFSNQTGGMKILGSYQTCNDQAMADFLKSKTDKFQSYLDNILEILHDRPKTALDIMRMCILPKIFHLSRTIPPKFMKPWAKDIDSRVNIVCERILHLKQVSGDFLTRPNANEVPFDEWPMEFRRLRTTFAFAGVGIPAIQNMCDTTFIAGFASAYANLDQQIEINDDFLNALWNVTECLREPLSAVGIPPEILEILDNHRTERIATFNKFFPEDFQPGSIDNLQFQTFKQYLLDNTSFIKQFFKKGTQKKLVNLIYASKADDILKEIALIQDVNIRKRRLAIYLSNTGKHGALFSKIVPYSWDIRPTPENFRFNIHRLLDMPINAGFVAEQLQLKCNCNYSSKIDAYGHHIYSCHRTAGHNAIVSELDKMCNAAGLKTIVEPTGVMTDPNHPNARPDLLVPGLDNGKDVLIDVKTITPIRENILGHCWKKAGYAAEFAVKEKEDHYQGKYDTDRFTFTALGIELSGRPSITLEKFIKKISMIAQNESSRDVNDGSPTIYAKQFAHKWTLRLMARFKLVMAERAINHLNKLIRLKTMTSYVPLVYEERFD